MGIALAATAERDRRLLNESSLPVSYSDKIVNIGLTESVRVLTGVIVVLAVVAVVVVVGGKDEK